MPYSEHLAAFTILCQRKMSSSFILSKTAQNCPHMLATPTPKHLFHMNLGYDYKIDVGGILGTRDTPRIKSPPEIEFVPDPQNQAKPVFWRKGVKSADDHNKHSTVGRLTCKEEEAFF